jgi:Chromate resistance exported protein
VLWEIGKIVHEADLADERYDAPEVAGLDVLLRGLSMIRDDEQLLALAEPVFDGLYGLVEQVGDVGVVEGVDDVAAAPFADHEPEVAQDAQLL